MRTTAANAAAGLAVAIGLLVAPSGHAAESGEPVVHTTTIGRRLLERRLSVYGQIVPEPATPGRPAAAASVSCPTGGPVAAVLAVEGQAVEPGEVVVQLDSRRADAEVERARATVTQATAEAERQRRLAAHDDSSKKQREIAERQLVEAEAALAEARAARDYLEVRAPLGGTVLRVGVRPGEVVQVGDVVAEIVDLDRLVAEVRVPAAELSRVRAGEAAVVEVAGRHADGRVVYVGSQVDPAGGTAPARIEMKSAHGMHPGDFARASIVVESRPDALAVPTSAVVYGADGTGEIAVLEDGRARRRPVRLGIEDGDWVEIEGDGIRPGLRIVTREAYGLPDDTPVRVVEE